MRISSAFPSDFLKAADLQGREPTVYIDHVEFKDIGGDHKPVVYFQGKDKGLVLNKTNATNISTLYGDETEDWRGKAVTLFSTYVDFQGRSVEAIRVKPPRNNGNGAAQAPQNQGTGYQQPEPPAPSADPLEDSIPF